MDDLCRYAGRPFAFIFRYVRHRAFSHGVIAGAVLGAVACSITTQYGVKYLVDTLSGADRGNSVWFAFALLVSFIAADNLLWRIAGFTMSSAFVRVTGDLRRDLFRHLTGHSPNYFANRLPGMLTARVTATSNAVFTVESMFSHEAHASKLAFAHLCLHLVDRGFSLVDCQYQQVHFQRFGAIEMNRNEYRKRIALGMIHPPSFYPPRP